MQETLEAEVASATPTESEVVPQPPPGAGAQVETPVAETLEELQAQLSKANQQVATYKKQLSERDRALSRRGVDQLNKLAAQMDGLDAKVDALVDITLPEDEETETMPLTARQKYQQRIQAKLQETPKGPPVETPEQIQLKEKAKEYGINLSDPAPEDEALLYRMRRLWEDGQLQETIAALEKHGIAKQEAAQAERTRRGKTALGIRTDRTPSMGGGKRTWAEAQKIKNITDISDEEYGKLIAEK